MRPEPWSAPLLGLIVIAALIFVAAAAMDAVLSAAVMTAIVLAAD